MRGLIAHGWECRNLNGHHRHSVAQRRNRLLCISQELSSFREAGGPAFPRCRSLEAPPPDTFLEGEIWMPRWTRRDLVKAAVATSAAMIGNTALPAEASTRSEA